MSKFIRKIARGFTLIELLVVIAIIAILAAVLTPAVTQALLRGKAMGLASNARSMYQSIFAKEISDAAYISTGVSFPKYNASPTTANEFKDSTDYFINVVTAEIMNVSFSFFAAPGIPSAKGKDPTAFKPENNAWCISAGLTDKSAEDVPFIFTRNMSIKKLSDATVASGKPKLGESGFENPFGDKAFVFATKGGSSYALLADSLKVDNFTSLFVTVGASNDVLRPSSSL